MAVPETDVVSLHASVRARGGTLATAESLTGGRVAAALTATPGASATFLGGVVAYATGAKVALLGVPAALVQEHGVVSGECAAAMAEGARTRFGATWGVSTTGVAGPDEQEGRSAGTVFVAVAGPSGTDVRRLALDGDRRAVTDAAVAHALAALDDVVTGRAPSSTGAASPRREASGLG